MNIVIIGGGAGGASTAARLRRLDEFANITLIDKSDSISQATCGIPYHIGQVIKDRDRMVVVEAESFAELLNIDICLNTEVIDIDPTKKSLTVVDHLNKRKRKISYDKLVMSPGTSPVYPDISGLEQPFVFTLNNLQQMDRVNQYITDNNCQQAVIIGGGFIGLEVADNLDMRGIRTTLVEASSQIMSSLDSEIASFIHEHMQQRGVNLLLNSSVTDIEANKVIINHKQSYEADLIILALGAKPQTGLAEKAGLRIGQSGGIHVNQGLMSSVSDIYVLGDAVESVDKIYHNKAVIQLAGPAHKQASVVSANLLGGHESYHSMQATSIVKVFDMTVASTGFSEKQLRKQNIRYIKSYTDVPAHASFYPESFPITIKLLFSPHTGTVLGAQIVGVRGVDKRIDVIASVIQFKGTVFDMAEMELAYAPPFSSAKDPINIAGMVARNMLQDGYQVVYWDTLDFHIQDGATIVDVRTQEEFELNHIEGAINIPLESLRQSINEIDVNNKTIICCQQGKKSYFAWRILSQHGFKHAYSLSGGLKVYFSATQQAKLESINSERPTLPVDNPDIDTSKLIIIDAVGLSCPGPIMKLNKEIRSARDGYKIKVSASDPGFANDIHVWCKKTGHRLENCDTRNAITTVIINKAS